MNMLETVKPKSDQLSADDLIGGGITIRITKVTGNDNAEQPVNIFYEGDNGKPYRPCKSMRRVLIHAWGDDSANYIGKSMSLYCDPEVAFGGMKVGGIRISHMSDIQRELKVALTASKGKRKPYSVLPLGNVKKQPTAEEKKAAAQKKADKIIADIKNAESVEDVDKVLDLHAEAIDRLKNNYSEIAASIIEVTQLHIDKIEPEEEGLGI